MSQTAYTQDPAVAFEGMLVDLGNKDILTAIASETIPFGRAIARIAPLAGADPTERPPRCRLTAVENDIITGVFLGVSLSDVTLDKPAGAAERDGYLLNDTVRYLRSGRRWVFPEQVIAFGDLPAARFTAAAPPLDRVGALTDVDDANTALIPGASFRSANAVALEPVVLELRP